MSRPRSRGLVALVVVLVGSLSATPIRSAESFDNCSGFIDSVPATIGAQGVWCLRRNLSTSVTSGNAIVVSNNNVTIDCNGYKIDGSTGGAASSSVGIYSQNRANISVRNCRLRGFTRAMLLSGPGQLVENNRVDNSGFIGIAVEGSRGVVLRNQVFSTNMAGNGSAIGIAATGGIDVLHNTVAGVSARSEDYYGIYAINNRGGVIRGNHVSELESVDATGVATAIYSGGAGALIADNHMVATAANNVPGYSILAPFSICTGNTAGGFAIGAFTCPGGGNNHHY